MLAIKSKALSKKHSVQQQLTKHFRNPLVIKKKKSTDFCFQQFL